MENVTWGPESAERLRSFLLLLTTTAPRGRGGLQADSAGVPVTPGPWEPRVMGPGRLPFPPASDCLR